MLGCLHALFSSYVAEDAFLSAWVLLPGLSIPALLPLPLSHFQDLRENAQGGDLREFLCHALISSPGPIPSFPTSRRGPLSVLAGGLNQLERRAGRATSPAQSPPEPQPLSWGWGGAGGVGGSWVRGLDLEPGRAEFKFHLMP